MTKRPAKEYEDQRLRPLLDFPDCTYCDAGIDPNSNGYHFVTVGDEEQFIACPLSCQNGNHTWVRKGYRTETEIGPESTAWMECERCGEARDFTENEL